MAGDDLPRLRPVADHALLVDLALEWDATAAARVRALDAALAAAPAPGQVQVVPALVNLLIDFDPCRADHAAVAAHVRGLLSAPPVALPPPAVHAVPFCPDPPFAPDLDEVARRTGLSPDRVIAALTAADYRVTMFGFAPGYAYLAGTPAAIALDRKPAPRRDVPAGSVIVAGAQALITALTMPTGWWVLGRSPFALTTGDPARPYVLAVGDVVRFHRIPAAAMPGGAA